MSQLSVRGFSTVNSTISDKSRSDAKKLLFRESRELFPHTPSNPADENIQQWWRFVHASEGFEFLKISYKLRHNHSEILTFFFADFHGKWDTSSKKRRRIIIVEALIFKGNHRKKIQYHVDESLRRWKSDGSYSVSRNNRIRSERAFIISRAFQLKFVISPENFV